MRTPIIYHRVVLYIEASAASDDQSVLSPAKVKKLITNFVACQVAEVQTISDGKEVEYHSWPQKWLIDDRKKSK